MIKSINSFRVLKNILTLVSETAFKNNQRPIDTFVNSAIYTRRSTSCVREAAIKENEIKVYSKVYLFGYAKIIHYLNLMFPFFFQ